MPSPKDSQKRALWIKHQSESHIGKGINRQFTIEHRKNLSDSHRGSRNVNYKRLFSNQHRERLSESRLGNKNNNWKGGVSFEPYCPKFTKEFKERVRVFFKHTCQLCGHVWERGETKLAVHHVNYRKDLCCNDVKPLFVPLCSGSCHSITNFNRSFWEDWFTEIINEFYNGKCYTPLLGSY